MTLHLHITFTAGHYHGAEWPPAPARLFQALVAASHSGAFGLHEPARRDAALRWLEQQPPPLIRAALLTQQHEALVEYVPNNDNRRSHIRAEKSMSRWSMPYAEASLIYEYPVEAAALGHAGDIAVMACLIRYLGRTIDTTLAHGQVLPSSSLIPTSTLPVWTAQGTSGAHLLPAAGFLDFLNARYPRSVSEMEPDFSNSARCTYNTAQQPPTEPLACYALHELGSDKPKAYPPWSLRAISGLVRGAMVEWAALPATQREFGPDRLAQLVHGHRHAGASAPAEGGHFIIQPLPSQTRDFKADGWLRRVGIIGRGCQNAEDQALFDAMSRWLSTCTVRDQGIERYHLKPVPHTVADPLGLLRPLPPESGATVWRSITPIILPSLPRRGRTPEDGLLRALVLQGILAGSIDSIATFTGPVLPKTLNAREYNIASGTYLAKYPRYHAEIRFKSPISGPLILGSGRYVGFGLFVPVDHA